MRADADIRNWAVVTAVALVMLAGCSGEKRAATAPPPPKAAAAPVGPAAAIRPEGADAVDTAVVEMQLFKAAAFESLIDIAATEAAIRTLTAKALDAARRIEAAPPAQRPTLARTYAGAIADRDAAHAKLAASLEAFRTTSAGTMAIVEATAPACAGAVPAPPVAPVSETAPAVAAVPAAAPPPDGTLATYVGCGVLLRDQADMTKTLENLSKAFESAEAAYSADRRRLDEAAATMALVR